MNGVSISLNSTHVTNFATCQCVALERVYFVVLGTAPSVYTTPQLFWSAVASPMLCRVP